ncbi:hypothetical protein KEM55_004618 [Ascosphaera atra]|nr:hypothetical protein KEM55_004618 [Ascosphaera atra]
MPLPASVSVPPAYAPADHLQPSTKAASMRPSSVSAKSINDTYLLDMMLETARRTQASVSLQHQRQHYPPEVLKQYNGCGRKPSIPTSTGTFTNGGVNANAAANAAAVAAALRQNPRRTSAAARRAPYLRARSDGVRERASATTSSATTGRTTTPRDDSFVDRLVASATSIVETIWPRAAHSSLGEPCHQVSREKLSLRTFIQEVLRRSRSSYSTLQVALYYLILIKDTVEAGRHQPEGSRKVKRVVMCGRRMFLTALMLASKYLQDRNYSARAWAKISGLDVHELNANELTFLLAVDWKLHIPEPVFQRWNAIVVRLSEEKGGKEVVGWKEIVPRLTPQLDTVGALLNANPKAQQKDAEQWVPHTPSPALSQASTATATSAASMPPATAGYPVQPLTNATIPAASGQVCGLAPITTGMAPTMPAPLEPNPTPKPRVCCANHHLPPQQPQQGQAQAQAPAPAGPRPGLLPTPQSTPRNQRSLIAPPSKVSATASNRSITSAALSANKMLAHQLYGQRVAAAAAAVANANANANPTCLPPQLTCSSMPQQYYTAPATTTTPSGVQAAPAPSLTMSSSPDSYVSPGSTCTAAPASATRCSSADSGAGLSIPSLNMTPTMTTTTTTTTTTQRQQQQKLELQMRYQKQSQHYYAVQQLQQLQQQQQQQRGYTIITPPDSNFNDSPEESFGSQSSQGSFGYASLPETSAPMAAAASMVSQQPLPQSQPQLQQQQNGSSIDMFTHEAALGLCELSYAAASAKQARAQEQMRAMSLSMSYGMPPQYQQHQPQQPQQQDRKRRFTMGSDEISPFAYDAACGYAAQQQGQGPQDLVDGCRTLKQPRLMMLQPQSELELYGEPDLRLSN